MGTIRIIRKIIITKLNDFFFLVIFVMFVVVAPGLRRWQNFERRKFMRF